MVNQRINTKSRWRSIGYYTEIQRQAERSETEETGGWLNQRQTCRKTRNFFFSKGISLQRVKILLSKKHLFNLLCLHFYVLLNYLLWWLIVLIISLSSLVGPWVFQLAVKLVKIFEQKCKTNWKVQVSAPTTRIGDLSFVHRKTKCKQNKFMSCHEFNWRNEKLGTRMRLRNILVRWHLTNNILNLDM